MTTKIQKAIASGTVMLGRESSRSLIAPASQEPDTQDVECQLAK